MSDDQPLDLAGAFPDPVDAQLAEEALGDVLAHIATAAENLHCAVGDPARHLGGIELRHGALGMARLAVDAGVDLLRRAIGHEPGGPELGQAVGQHELDRLLLGDGFAEGDAGLGECRRLVDQPLGGTAAARGNAQALVAEPVIGEFHAPAFLADAVGDGHADVLEAVDGMMGGVVVGIGGGADQSDARGFHIDEEEAVGAGMGAAGELGLEDEMIGVIGAGDMPFLAVQDVIPALAPGRGLDRVDVRARLGLGDGIAFMALAADVRFDPGLHLMRRAGTGLDHPGRSRAVAPAQRIGDLADLLLDDDLLEAAEARPAEVAGDGQRMEADLPGDALVPRPDLRRQLAAVHLRRDLMRDQLLCDEAAHLLLPGTRGRGQGVGHGSAP